MSLREKFHNHPAVVFGKWLKEKRCEKDFTLSRFATAIGMNVSKYSQVEMGIGDWLEKQLECWQAIPKVLNLTQNECDEGIYLYLLIGNSQILQMTDLFTRDEMRPAFPPEKNWTKEKEEQLLDAVFKPLE